MITVYDFFPRKFWQREEFLFINMKFWGALPGQGGQHSHGDHHRAQDAHPEGGEVSIHGYGKHEAKGDHSIWHGEFTINVV